MKRNKHKKILKEKEIFTVSEFASLTEVTPETLRYYDRIGLMSPGFRNPQSGYRYYTLRDFENFSIIRTLQSMDVPLNDIKTYLETRTIRSTRSLLREQYRNACEKLKKMQQITSYLHEKLGSVDSLTSNADLDKIQKKHLEKRIGFVSSKTCATYEEYQMDTARLMLDNKYNRGLYLSNSFATLKENSGRREQFHCVLMNIDDTPPEGAKLITFPYGDYLTLQYHGTFLDSREPVNKIKKYIKNNHLRADESFLFICIIDETFTNDPREYITEAQIHLI